ncbi:probable translation initiation factor IF-2 [Leptospira johnsonii]|uniref:Probable translation initiation factor IF-2 n=1 Tax=Leptospira johnsonii TaxID=1917820 RepID=A0A2P2D7Y2_9LEPT|nr:probable translation initiation factor IF-2 [Leptospira johnsonii]
MFVPTLIAKDYRIWTINLSKGYILKSKPIANAKSVLVRNAEEFEIIDLIKSKKGVWFKVKSDRLSGWLLNPPFPVNNIRSTRD